MRGLLLAVWVAWVAGCGFQPSQLGSAHSDGPPVGSDGPRVIDAAITGDDAKVFMDASAVPHGSLSVTSTTLGGMDLDLSVEGSIDWAHWGYTGTNSFDDKSNGGTAISDLTATPSVAFTGAPFTASWSGGTPHANVSMTSTGVGVHQGSAMTFTVAATTTPRVLALYVGAQNATGRLDVSLSDDSAPAQTKTLTSATSTTNVRYAITFNAASPGTTLNVSWTDANDFTGSPFAALLEATLAPG